MYTYLFEIIWIFLHFNDNTTRPDNCTDRLYKICPVLDHLVSKFHEMYQPKSHICIDEGMFQWRGRLAFRVCNPQKPIKYGVKSYILCDSDSGYCFNMKPYCQESTTLGDTVVSLLDRLVDHGYRLFKDNLYNFVRLCERLLDIKKTMCVVQLGKTEVNRRSFEMSEMLTLGLRKQSCVTTKMWWSWHGETNSENGYNIPSEQHGTCWGMAERSSRKSCKAKTSMHCGIQSWNECRWQTKTKHCVIPFYQEVTQVDEEICHVSISYQFVQRFVIYKAKNPQGNCNTLLSFIQSVIKSWTSPRVCWWWGGKCWPSNWKHSKSTIQNWPNKQAESQFCCSWTCSNPAHSQKATPNQRMQSLCT